MTKLIVSDKTNPYYNLAVEEWAVRNIDTSECDYLFVYINTDCVVVGRNQNVFQEVNLNYCKTHDIQVCRRVSGGGTVFHDKGNLNWTFISKFETNKVNDYKEFASSVITVLKKLNLEAFLNERNAIMVGDYKLSGQAQFTNRKNILSHGTLLYDSDIEKLNSSTILKNKLVVSKASKSVRSDVKTIRDLSIKNIESLESVKQLLIQENCGQKPLFFDIETKEIKLKIQELFKKYQTKEWIYNRSSACEITETINSEDLILIIQKSMIVLVKNKKGEEINHHPLLNSSYLDLI